MEPMDNTQMLDALLTIQSLANSVTELIDSTLSTPNGTLSDEDHRNVHEAAKAALNIQTQAIKRLVEENIMITDFVYSLTSKIQKK